MELLQLCLDNTDISLSLRWFQSISKHTFIEQKKSE